MNAAMFLILTAGTILVAVGALTCGWASFFLLTCGVALWASFFYGWYLQRKAARGK